MCPPHVFASISSLVGGFVPQPHLIMNAPKCSRCKEKMEIVPDTPGLWKCEKCQIFTVFTSERIA